MPGSAKLGLLAVGLLAASLTLAQVPLPGTQPREGNLKLETINLCASCHGQTGSGQRDPYQSWQSGLMAFAAKDPVFRAALSVANQDIPGIGEFCLRCHAPRGFLAGRALPADGSALDSDDLMGVTCAVCHRLVDPRAAEARWLVKVLPPGLGNGMMVLDPAYVMHGPYGDDPRIRMRPHGARKSLFLIGGDVCGTCHDVSNPRQAVDPATQPPHAYGHIERTYSEWALSEYATRGAAGTCQSCHYPAVTGGGYPTRFRENPKREHFAEHGPAGGSTWVQETIWRLWPAQDLDRPALRRGQEKARAMLRAAATLELTFPNSDQVRLRITNETGHKLPTGYPEGRRMWVNVRFFDAEGRLLDEIGRYGEQEMMVRGRKVQLPTLLDPQRTRVYECLPALSPEQARKFGKQPGPSFFFVLNDQIAKDNRIPPRGFNNAAFAEHLCQPVGASYADGQHWDEIDWALPPGTVRVSARLMYQSVSAEYVVFFAEEDRSSDWGTKLYDVWTQTGHCPPEIIAEVARQLASPPP